MISTVVTASTASIATNITGPLTVIGVVLLIAVLIQKELIGSSESAISKRINQVLNIAVPPLVLSFIGLVVVKVMTFFN
ncbi:MAG: hypothetical protein ABFS17_00415 [Chloroflexota bacterium]